jgi:cell division protease FtsH
MEKKPEGSRQPPEKPQQPSDKPPQRQRFNTSTLWLILVLVLVAGFLFFQPGAPKRSEIDYGYFRKNLEDGYIKTATVKGAVIEGEFKTSEDDKRLRDELQSRPQADTDGDGILTPPEKDGKKLLKEFYCEIPSTALVRGQIDELLYKELGENYAGEEPSDSTGMLLGVYILVTIVLFAGVWFMFRRTRDQVLGGGILSGFSKSPAKRYQTGDKNVTFDDVAGLEGVKQELEEIVEFLKDPARFQRLGGRVPKGVLLNGPPGAGKTLLARAVAGEAGVPFFSISGSEFIQMFVGVGASRVRDMFQTAKESAPSILFIDEIDAVGRHRGAGLGGGHDEREQTLNQILSEMDGFSQTESVIVMAATNRPDVLDPALLRPGRFDRHITVDRPNYKGRLAIFKVHCREVPLADDVDLERLAHGTVGLTGADIRNLVNESALWATRKGKEKVDMADFEYARDKVLMGAKREEVLIGKEKSMTAYHEAGHVLLAWVVDAGDRVHKVSIIPRGRSLGATQLLPEEDRVNISESELHSRLAFMLGGRAAEKLAFDELSAGAEDDLKKATHLARRMVTHWGMSERLGPVAFRHGEEHPFLGREMAEPREFSEYTARVIDEEIARILRMAEERAEKILREHHDKLTTLASALEKEETLDERQIESLIGPAAYVARRAAAETEAKKKSEEVDPRATQPEPATTTSGSEATDGPGT